MTDDDVAIEREAVAAIAADARSGEVDVNMMDEGDVLGAADAKVDSAPKEADPIEESEDVDAQLEAMKRKLLSVEEQQEEINEGDNVATGDAAPAKNASAAPAPSNGNANGAAATTSASAPTVHQRPSVADAEAAVAESDGRSVYVGNVDYGATVEELGAHFADCGTINRVTIMTNKATGMPKGYAYIEFADESSVKHAEILDNTTFRQRKIKVTPKRTNVPGMSFRGRRPRYRGGYSRRSRRGFRGRWAPY